MTDKKITELVRPETLRGFKDGYVQPTAKEVRGVLSAGGLTGSAAGALVGVDGRTIRKWTGDERPIPFAAWRLLCIYAGLVRPSVGKEFAGCCSYVDW